MVPQISGVEARRDSLLSSVCRSTFDVRASGLPRACSRALFPFNLSAREPSIALLHCCNWSLDCALRSCRVWFLRRPTPRTRTVKPTRSHVYPCLSWPSMMNVVGVAVVRIILFV